MLRLKVAFLAMGMLATGTINTLSTKFQDMTVVAHTDDGYPIHFKHPAVQSACMFAGELLCLIPYFLLVWRKRRQEAARGASEGLAPLRPKPRRGDIPQLGVRRMFAFLIPAMCDACATTLLNVGLYYTFASTFQMLRGTLVLFAGLFTVLILRRQLYIHHWLGMTLITAGAAIVGAASVLYSQSESESPESPPPGGDSLTASALLPRGHGGSSFLHGPKDSGGSGDGSQSSSAPLFGNLCVIGAQMFAALQFITEEKFLAQYRVPALLAVGLEGFWGIVLCVIALPLLSTIRAADGLPLDDAIAAVQHIAASPALQAAVIGSIISIAFFNFFGISVTKSLSGASRATIDACRTLFIWLACIGLGWERFLGLEVLGFVVLVSGTSLYNELLRSCLPTGWGAEDDEDEEDNEDDDVEENSVDEEAGGDEEDAAALGGGEGGARGDAQGGAGRSGPALLGGGVSESHSGGEVVDMLRRGGATAAGTRGHAPLGGGGGGADRLQQDSNNRSGRAGLQAQSSQDVCRQQAGVSTGSSSAGPASGQQASVSRQQPQGVPPRPPMAVGSRQGSQRAMAVPRRTQPGRHRSGGGGGGGASSDDTYTLARSMRLGFSTLSPAPLDYTDDLDVEGQGANSESTSDAGTPSQPNRTLR